METVALLFCLALLVAQAVWVRRLQGERRQLQRELRRVLRAGAGRVEAQAQELRWRHVLSEAVPLPTLVTNQERQILYANPAAQTLFGRVAPREAAIERLRHHRLEMVLDEARERGQTEPEVIAIQDHQFMVVARAWQEPTGGPGGAILLLHDVTDLYRLARARREMASNLAHELRTPLASVKLMTETLRAGGAEQPTLVHKLATRIATENDAMIRLIEDLTALSWIESGRTPLRLESTSLRALVELRMGRLAPQLELKGLRIHLASPDDPIVALDPERFGQVLTNLLDNAIKFSPAGGAICVAIAADESGTTLTVRDEGPGIAPADLPRIFERFYKGDRVRTRSNATGTGLGLAIARHLVEAHGGTLHAESELGRGATFVIRLPRD